MKTLYLSFLGALAFTLSQAQSGDTTFRSSGNPVFKHKFTADPAGLVHSNKLYIYTGHDECPPDKNFYFMYEWLVFSTEDMVNWTEHPVPLKVSDLPGQKAMHGLLR